MCFCRSSGLFSVSVNNRRIFRTIRLCGASSGYGMLVLMVVRHTRADRIRGDRERETWNREANEN